MKDLVILGTGGNCLDILDAVLEINESRASAVYRVRGFLDDNRLSGENQFHGYPVLGPLGQAGKYSDCFFVNGIGSFRNYWRKPAILATTGLGLDRFETIIHPRASVSRFASLGPGTVVLQTAT